MRRLGGQPERHRTDDQLSARNRFPGVVRSVEVDGVMGIVELECGPHLVTAAITRDAIEQLGLEPGIEGDRDGQGDLGHGDRRVRRLAALATAAALALAGCGDDDDGEATRRRTS